jgi:hypothetical protein
MKSAKPAGRDRRDLANASPFQRLQNFFVSREPIDFVLAENHLVVGDDIEDATFALDQRRVDSGCFFDCFRQTGGFGCVVSLHAIGDRNPHRSFSLEKFH